MTDSYTAGAKFAIETYGSVYGGPQPRPPMTDVEIRAKMAKIDGLVEFYDKMLAMGSPMAAVIREQLATGSLEFVCNRSDKTLLRSKEPNLVINNLG